jgi:hypothetical protein
MAQIYAGAGNVLVLDLDLQHVPDSVLHESRDIFVSRLYFQKLAFPRNLSRVERRHQIQRENCCV